jgi:hypothetical protein
MMRSIMTISLLALLPGLVTGQAKLPAFRMATASNRYVDSKDVVIKKPVLLIYFEPDCHDCQQFTMLLAREDAIFKSYKVIMITNSGLDQLKRFVGVYKLSNRRDLLIGTEGWTRSVQRTLNIARFPYIAIYNKRSQLTKVINDRKPEAIIKQLYDQL